MVVRTCDRCGKQFVAEDAVEWAYKREMRMPGDRMQKMHWFHTWSCLVAAQKEADAYFEPILREMHERELEKKKVSERERRLRRKERQRDGTRCKAESSCAVPDNKERKKENLSL